MPSFGLSVGIVGLPNVGKSTLFNALLKRQIAQVAEYPFTTIEPHKGVVEVPDERLSKLCELIRPEKCVPAAIEFIDIAGLVKGAVEGEGLGNQFLSHIREVDAILHVVRGFTNDKVPHVVDDFDPKRDIEIVDGELRKAGIEKPTMYVVNVDEQQLTSNNSLLTGEHLTICAKLEMELSELSEEEQKAYMKELGTNLFGLDKVIKNSYQLLNLISFYTIKGGKQVQAWPLKRGLIVIDAAGIVHSDFATGFIKAEVIEVNQLLELGGWLKAKEAGKVRLEGRDYIMQDGDVVEFKIGS